ncbi:protein-export chaperone SecB [Pseudoalteromonas sp. Z9A6]|uniref:protein-export chaperone SecB n=1 Tax=Pseudoalteromonas sp. Z9A6 TaxID=2686352 RepID=UPI0013FDEE0A|nr:protein-export chaperone SecB [Pseudoalteromonas sp. Z9A6]
MNIQLHINKAKEINLIDKDQVEDFDQIDEFGFHYEPKFSDKPSDKFDIFFALRLKIKNSHLLLLEYESTFKLDDKFDDEFVNSHFPHVNAPAIAFPYMRAFVSTLLLNAGYEPIMLPSVNFSAMYKDMQEKDS